MIEQQGDDQLRSIEIVTWNIIHHLCTDAQIYILAVLYGCKNIVHNGREKQMQWAVTHWDHLVAQEVQWLEDWEVEAEVEEVQPFLARIIVVEDMETNGVQWRGKINYPLRL